MNCPHYTKGKCKTKGEVTPGKLLRGEPTEAQKKASRKNGGKGGRPVKEIRVQEDNSNEEDGYKELFDHLAGGNKGR